MHGRYNFGHFVSEKQQKDSNLNWKLEYSNLREEKKRKEEKKCKPQTDRAVGDNFFSLSFCTIKSMVGGVNAKVSDAAHAPMHTHSCLIGRQCENCKIDKM